MTPDPKRSKETVKQGEVRESNALPGESPEKKKVRFLPEPGGGGACAISVGELVEDHWSGERQGEMFEGLHCKAEPDLDVINTEAALDRLLENGVVRDIPRDEGGGNLEERQQRVGVQSSLRGTRMQITRVPRRSLALVELWTFSRSSDVCQPSLWIARMPFIKLLSWKTCWWNHPKSI